MIETPTSSPRAPAAEAVASEPRARRAWLGLSDRGLVLGLAVAILAITALPYLFAYRSSPADRHFVGIVFNVPDHLQYFSWLRDHRHAWLVANRMTPEPNSPALFNLLWLCVAQIQVITGWSVAALFQGTRLIAGAALLLVLYPVCGLFTRTRAERWTAYLLIVLGSGLGWIWVVDKAVSRLPDLRYPFDVHVAEPNTLFIIMAYPHFTIAAALILAVFICFLRALRRQSWAWALLGALLALTLTLQHAYDLLLITLVPAGALGLLALRDRRIPWRAGAMLALIVGVAAPPAAYFTLLTSRDPLWREVLAQFANAGVFTPRPLHLLVLMGVPLIVALAAGAWGLVRLVGQARSRGAGAWAGWQASDADLFLWSWFAVGLALLYIPADFQIHMLNTWQVPVGLIAVRALHRQFMPWLAKRRPRLVRLAPLVLVLAALPTSCYLLSWRILDLGRHRAPYYVTAGEDAALEWLGEHAGPQDVVLSGLALGQFVPARSDARAFLGHWAQTVDFYGKQTQVEQFFSAAAGDAARRALLQRYSVTYVLYGSEERALGGYDPAQDALLEPVFSNGDVVIYRRR
jgi:hypothetical protein